LHRLYTEWLISFSPESSFVTKPLLILCIVVSLAAAALGFLNRGKLSAAKEELNNTGSQAASTRLELETAKKEIETKSQELAALGTEKSDLNTKLTEVQGELTKVKEELAAAQEKATTATGELEQLKTDAGAKDTRITELEQQLATAQSATPETPVEGPDTAELQARVTELETINNQLQDQNTGLTTQIAELQRKEDGRQKVQMRQGLTGTILAVNQAWNFVVLSMGDRQGVVPNAEMLVQRGNQYLGKVRVTSVEPSTSIADILVRTVPRGFTVMPGDQVIYQSPRD
jgi:predicted  nucleic acid-binding Zn-ribbon protein